MSQATSPAKWPTSYVRWKVPFPSSNCQTVSSGVTLAQTEPPPTVRSLTQSRSLMVRTTSLIAGSISLMLDSLLRPTQRLPSPKVSRSALETGIDLVTFRRFGSTRKTWLAIATQTEPAPIVACVSAV